MSEQSIRSIVLNAMMWADLTTSPDSSLEGLRERHALTDEQVQDFLAGSEPVRILLAQHPDLPEEVVAALERDPAVRVRIVLAQTPAGSVREPVDGDDSDVHRARALGMAHHSSDATLLEALADHPDDSVVRAVSQNPATPLRTAVAMLAAERGDTDFLTGRPDLPEDVVLGLHASTFGYARTWVQSGEDTIEDDDRRIFAAYLRACGTHPSRDMIDALLEDWGGSLADLVTHVEALDR